MSEKIKIFDKEFETYIPYNKILENVHNLAEQLNNDLQKKEVLFLGVLNGSFMFAAELLKEIDFPCEVSFVKVASYQGDSTTGTVKRLIGVNEDLEGKTVVIVEDIIDTGITTDHILKQLSGYAPQKIIIVSLFFKPGAFTKDYKVDYYGMELPDYFIVGHGLDYKGLGRNLKDVYKLID